MQGDATATDGKDAMSMVIATLEANCEALQHAAKELAMQTEEWCELVCKYTCVTVCNVFAALQLDTTVGCRQNRKGEAERLQ